MSLFQCSKCGCVENTALSDQGFLWKDLFDWTGIEEYKEKGKLLCSECGPKKFASGKPRTRYVGWHGKFNRVYLPKGKFHTNKVGNLEHNETGEEDYTPYILEQEEIIPQANPSV